MDNIVAIIDRSGSMMGSEKDTIDGFNEFIGEQLSISDDAVVTLVLFDHRYEEVYTNVPIPDVPRLTDKEYYVRGSTALNDAIGKAIVVATEFELNNDVDKTIFSIFTDGGENASKEFNSASISNKVKSLEKGDWEFIYVGCDHNVHAAAKTLGFKLDNTISMSKGNLRSSLSDITTVGYAASVASYRTTKK